MIWHTIDQQEENSETYENEYVNKEEEFIEEVLGSKAVETNFKSLFYHINRTEILIGNADEDSIYAFYKFKTQLIRSIVQKHTNK